MFSHFYISHPMIFRCSPIMCELCHFEWHFLPFISWRMIYRVFQSLQLIYERFLKMWFNFAISHCCALYYYIVIFARFQQHCFLFDYFFRNSMKKGRFDWSLSESCKIQVYLSNFFRKINKISTNNTIIIKNKYEFNLLSIIINHIN